MADRDTKGTRGKERKKEKRQRSKKEREKESWREGEGKSEKPVIYVHRAIAATLNTCMYIYKLVREPIGASSFFD